MFNWTCKLNSKVLSLSRFVEILHQIIRWISRNQKSIFWFHVNLFSSLFIRLLLTGMDFLVSNNLSPNRAQWRVWWVWVHTAVTNPVTTHWTTWCTASTASTIHQTSDQLLRQLVAAITEPSSSLRSMRSESIQSFPKKATLTFLTTSLPTGSRNMLWVFLLCYFSPANFVQSRHFISNFLLQRLYGVRLFSFIRMTETHWKEVLLTYRPLKSSTMKNR